MSFDVIITSFPETAGMSVSKALEELFGFETEHARSLARSLPVTVITGTSKAHAEIAAQQLRAVGADVQIVDRSRVRTGQSEGVVPEQQGGAKPFAKTEAWGGGSAHEAADALLQKSAPTLQGFADEPARAAIAQATARAAGEPAPRKMFSTVAMQNIEADLKRFETTDFGPAPSTEHNNWADSMPPPALPSQPNKALSAQALAMARNKAAAKADLPDVDALFTPPSQETAPAAGFKDRKVKGELDDLFSPPGADQYFRRKVEDAAPPSPAAARESVPQARSSRLDDNVRPSAAMKPGPRHPREAAIQVAASGSLKAWLTRMVAYFAALFSSRGGSKPTKPAPRTKTSS